MLAKAKKKFNEDFEELSGNQHQLISANILNSTKKKTRYQTSNIRTVLIGFLYNFVSKNKFVACKVDSP